MASGSDNESDNTEGFIAAFLDEGARLFDDICSPREADLAAAVDGSNGIECNYSTASQGRHVSSIYFTRDSTRGVHIVEYRLIILWLPCIVQVK